MDDANAVFPCPLRGLEFGCEAQPSCDEVATLKQMVIAVCDTVETPVYEVLSFVAVQLPPSLHRPHTPPPFFTSTELPLVQEPDSGTRTAAASAGQLS